MHGGGKGTILNYPHAVLTKAGLQGRLANQSLTYWGVSELGGRGHPTPARSGHPDSPEEGNKAEERGDVHCPGAWALKDEMR